MRPIDTLTEEEFALIEMVAQGSKNKEISVKMGLGLDVTKNKIHAIYDKVGVDSRLELAMWWLSTNPPEG